MHFAFGIISSVAAAGTRHGNGNAIVAVFLLTSAYVIPARQFKLKILLTSPQSLSYTLLYPSLPRHACSTKFADWTNWKTHIRESRRLDRLIILAPGSSHGGQGRSLLLNWFWEMASNNKRLWEGYHVQFWFCSATHLSFLPLVHQIDADKSKLKEMKVRARKAIDKSELIASEVEH